MNPAISTGQLTVSPCDYQSAKVNQAPTKPQVVDNLQMSKLWLCFFNRELGKPYILELHHVWKVDLSEPIRSRSLNTLSTLFHRQIGLNKMRQRASSFENTFVS